MTSLADLRRQFPDLEGLDDESAVDAIQQAFYPDFDRQQIADRLGVKFAPVEEAVEPRGLLRGAADLGIEAVSGVARGVQFTADAFGADNPASSAAGAVDEFAREYLSAQAKSDDRRISEIMAQAEDAGIWEQVKAAAQAFAQAPGRMAVNALGTSVPTIAAALIPGVGQAGTVGRLAALGGMGAVQGAGVVKGSIYERVKAEHEAAGVPADEAAALAQQAQEYGGPNSGNIAGGAGLGAAAAATGAQPIIARLLQRGGTQAAAQGAERGLAARTAMGVFAETPLEAAQGGQEQYAGNVALQNEGFDEPTWRGVAGNAALEGLAAAGPGGIAGAMDVRSDPVDASRRLAEADNVEDMITAANDLAMAPLDVPQPVRPRAAGADIMAEIRQLEPAQQSEAIGLLSAAGNANAPAHVRRFAQNRLDELLLPFRQPAVGEATELDIEQVNGDRMGFRSPGQIAADGLQAMADERRAAAARAAAAPIPAGDATEIEPDEVELGRIPVGEAVEIGGPRPEGMAERTGSRDGQVLDLSGRAAVAQYVSRMRQTNTPAARAFVGEYDAGRITPDDVMALLPRPASTPAQEADQRLAAAAAQAPTIQPGDLLTADGMPYGTKAAASVRATREGGGQVVQVPGGFVVRQESTREPVADLAGPAAVPAAPADGFGDQPGGSVGAVRPVPAAPEPAGAAAQAPALGGGPDSPVGGGAGGAPGALTPAYTDLMAGDGKPYTTRSGAAVRAKKEGGQVVEVDGGWIVRTGQGPTFTVSKAPFDAGGIVNTLVDAMMGAAKTDWGKDGGLAALKAAGFITPDGKSTPKGDALRSKISGPAASGKSAEELAGEIEAAIGLRSVKIEQGAAASPPSGAAAPADQTAPPQGRVPDAAAPAAPLKDRVDAKKKTADPAVSPAAETAPASETAAPAWATGDRASYKVALGGKDPWVEGRVTRVWRDAHGDEHVELDTGHKIDVKLAGDRLIRSDPADGQRAKAAIDERKRKAIAEAAEQRRAARETERSIFRELAALPAMVGKSVVEIAAEVRARLGDVQLADAKILLLARALHKDIGKRAAELAKQKHRNPAVRAAAVADAVAGQYPNADIPAEQQGAFIAGFDHAMAGKTKSTLSGEHLADRLLGYEAAKRWIDTEEGAAWYEGRPVNKLQNTGIDLRRWYEQMQAQMKAGESDISKAWKQIERATARADLFRPLLPDGVTPGFQTYIEHARSGVAPFKQWLEKNRAFDWSGSYAYRGRYSSKKTNTDYMLTGERYPGSLTREDQQKFQTDEAYRAAWLRDQAAEYVRQVREFTGLFEGVSSVREAATKFSERYIAREADPAQKRYYPTLKASGQSFSEGPLWPGSVSEFSQLRLGSDWTQTLIEKETTLALPDRATPLTPPRLDRVTRDGKDLRGGKNTTPQEVKDRFKFADVGFGKWVGAKQDQDHLNYANDAFMDLAAHFGAPLEGIGFGGGMHFTIGALGHGKYAAHFATGQPSPEGTVEVINVTNTKGDGTVYHEWVHALDHFLGGEWRAKVRPRVLSFLKDGVLSVERVERKAADFLVGGSYWKRDKNGDKVGAAIYAMSRPDVLRQGATAYKTNADYLGKDYWGNEQELLARAGEAWAADTLGFTNTYLVNPTWVGDGKVTKDKGYRGTPYPTGTERAQFNLIYTALAKSVKWSGGKPSVTMADFTANLPAEITAGEKRRDELKERKAMEALRDRLVAERADAAAERASAAAEKERREQAELDALAAEKIKALEPPIVDSPPASDTTGPLSDDDLAAIFDEAAAELREGAQEQPDVPPPGDVTDEAAVAPTTEAFLKWPQADLEEVLAKANDPDKVAIAGDPIWNVPDIHELGRMGDTKFLGDGMFETTGRDAAGKPWSMMWDGGGAMRRTAGGKAWTNVNLSGNTPYPSGVRRAIEAAIDRQAAARRQAAAPAPAPAPRKDAAPDPTAAKLIAEAAKLGVKGANEALTGLAKLFGSKPGRLNSFPAGFDEDTYRAARPHFQAALKAFQEAGKTLKDLFKMLIGQFGDGIKPYAVQFAKDEKLTSQLGAQPTGNAMVADKVAARLNAGHSFDWRVLFGWADEAFGGTQAEGKYTPKDAYDAMEMGVNRHILAKPGIYSPAVGQEDALRAVAALTRMTNLLPTQSKRTAEQDEFQQFSTVPPFAYAANWVANLGPTDTVGEFSAGIGGLAVFAKNAGARLVLNELSSRRAAVLQEVFPDARVFHENAEQIDNILPDDVKPTAVVINPPFSSSASTGVKNTMIGAKHVEQALARLVDGGRLVAIVGEGMAMDRPAFRAWWKGIQEKYDVRAAIPVDGSGYAKYGTTFDNALLVIDKVKPVKGRKPVTTPAKDYTELVGLLAEVRNDRPNANAPANDAAATQPNPDRGSGDAAAAGLGDAAGGPAGRGGAAGVGDGQPGGAPGLGAGGGSSRGAGGNARPGGDAPDAGRAGAGRGDQPRGGRADDAALGGRPDSARDASGVTIGGETAAAGEITDSVFEGYTPQRLQVPGAKPHPGALVQSAAMASVLPPAPTYVPNLPKDTITKGKLSLAQIESVVYAGQAHEQLLETTALLTITPMRKKPADFGLKDDTRYRRGFFIGDGTGVGKGREISGILLDNLRQGRKKHVWVSEKQGLMNDAKRDFQGVGGDDELIFNQNKTGADGKIEAAGGIIFTTYSTLRSGAAAANTKPATRQKLEKDFPPGTPLTFVDQDMDGDYEVAGFDPKNQQVHYKESGGWRTYRASFAEVEAVGGIAEWKFGRQDPSAKKGSGQSRLDQLAAWLGPDFDGVIAFDEAHNAGNAVPMKGSRGSSDASAQALAVVELQARLPNARVVYVSATGATEVSNLSFATRLGLWGPGTPFPSVQNFIAEMTAGGLATMELVARDMKQTGSYLARSLSFDGVTYSRIEHELTELQTDIYNRLADAWQVVLQNMNEALKLIGAKSDEGKTKNSKAVAAAKSAFWGAQQRFFNQIITSMQMPSVVEQIERDLAAGDAIVLQLVNTNEAQQERSLAKKADEGESDALEDLDLTPRDQLLQMVEKSFPVQQYQEEITEDGKKISVPVLDSEGNPVQNKQAVALRDKLLQDLKDIRVPDGPLEIILNTFGPEITAEVTGRKQRVIAGRWNKKDRTPGEDPKAFLQTRGSSAARADADAFMADKKRILVFSDAGGTGFSFQADLTKANQRKRKHYLLQPGWRANKAVQGLGRTHRTNQASAPHYALASTNIPAHKRFLSSIARRLDQLGALTKGQRDTSSGGLFSEKDNLESVYATQAAKRLINDTKAGQVEGLKFDEFLRQMGLEDIVNPDTGAIAETKYPETRLFLNRLLSLRLDMQEIVFNAFLARMEEQIELAAERGDLDTGIQTIRALSARVANEEIVYTDERTSAETSYIELELTQPTRMYPLPEERLQGAKIEWVTNVKSGRVWAKVRSGNMTLKNGAVVDRFRMLGTGGMQIKGAPDFKEGAYKTIDADKAAELWAEETAARPPTYTQSAHMIVGAMLPIWDRLKTDGTMQVSRTQTDDGRRLLGRMIAAADVKDILKRLNIQSPEAKLPPAQILARILKGQVAELANGWRLERARVSDDLRVEIKAGFMGSAAGNELVAMGVIKERIAWNERYFIPVSNPDVLASVLKNKPLVELKNPNDEDSDAKLSVTYDRLDAAVDRGYVPADTAAYEPAGDADTDSVQRLAARLNRGVAREHHVVLDAVAPRAGGNGARARELAAVSTVARRIFGHRVVFVRFQGRPLFNGVASDTEPNVVFLHADSKQPLMAVLGHELLHRMRMETPILYRDLQARLDRMMTGQSAYFDKLKAAYEHHGRTPPKEWMEELHADVVGDFFMDHRFWEEMAAEQPGLFRRVAAAILRFLDDVVAQLSEFRPFGTDKFVQDIAAARAAVASAMRQFGGAQVGAMTNQSDGISLSVAERQAVTDTAAFRKWFGDSKVVDADGKPLVVYHGTDVDFTAFDKDKIKSRFPFSIGYHFTTRPSEASIYASNKLGDQMREGGNVIPAYVRLLNPLIVDTKHPAASMEADLNSGPMFDKIAEARRAGKPHDGIIIRRDRGDEWDGWNVIAFRPEQIKSATGNTGAFDAANPDIRFSLADTVGTLRSIDQTKVRNAFADFVGNAGAKVSWWDKHLGTQYAKAEKFPGYKRVFEHVQQYIEGVSTMANEAADMAPAILPKLETWKDLRTSFTSYGLSKADAEAVAAPIFQGTLTDQKVYSDAELRTQFKLKPEQIKVYRQFLAAVNKSLDQVVAADVLKRLGDKNPGLRELALADRDAMRAGLEEYLAQQIEATTGKERDKLVELRDDIAEKYERIDKLKSEGYAPLMRFGQYKVFISDPRTGDSLFFGLYETRAEANRMARELAADPAFKDAKVEQGVLSREQFKLFSSIPVESLEMFAEAIGADQKEVFQAYLRLAKNNRSALKRLIHRKGTAGFSEDVPRVLAAFVTSNSRLASGSLNLAPAKDAINSIREGDIKDEAIELVDSVQNPKETAAAARSLMFMNFIGGSIASAAVNLTQPVTMTLPYLSQFGGLAKATARLMAAGKAAATGKVDDPELRAALKRAEDDGTVSPQEIHHLTAQAMGTWGNTALSKQAAFIWGAPFSLAEQFNRRVSFIAAYRTAKAEGIDNPFEFAEKAVIETQGLYNKGNMPNLSRSAIGASAMQFKQFSIHYLEWMQRMWNAGEAGSDQRRAGRRAVLIALALLMVAAGTDGLPFADDLDDLVDTIGQALGYNTNSKKARRDLIANTLGLGDMTADVVARGLSALPGVPMDVSLRMSMGNLIPASGLFLRSNTDRSRDLLEIAGPAGGLARQYMDAAQKGLAGDVGGMVAGAVPLAAQNAVKAMDMWTTGEARDTMGRKIMEADEVDGLMRFMGFNPAAIARESQKMGMIRRSEQLAKNIEGEIAAKWARGFADGDTEAVRAARAELADWNRRNPEDRITITSAQILQRVKKLRQSRAQRFVTSVSPERRAGVRELVE